MSRVESLAKVEYVRRPAGGGTPFVLGSATRTNKGWTFHPNVAGRKPSRFPHASLEKCLPRWIGYPDYCESRLVFGTLEGGTDHEAAAERARKAGPALLRALTMCLRVMDGPASPSDKKTARMMADYALSLCDPVDVEKNVNRPADRFEAVRSLPVV